MASGTCKRQTGGKQRVAVECVITRLGLPVLACRLASNQEVLSQVEAARLVAYGDVVAAREALQALNALPRREPRRMLVQHEQIAGRYGLPAMMARLEALYARHGVILPS